MRLDSHKLKQVSSTPSVSRTINTTLLQPKILINTHLLANTEAGGSHLQKPEQEHSHGNPLTGQLQTEKHLPCEAMILQDGQLLVHLLIGWREVLEQHLYIKERETAEI